MRKIMFSDKFHLTEAVLEGRKTMTRRIVPDGTPLGNWEETIKKSRYQLGEIVAVAQSYKDAGFDGEAEADSWAAKSKFPGKWNTLPGFTNKMFVQSEFMPHQIHITNIRVERLQDISDEDCFSEGIDVSFHNGHVVSYYRFENSRTYYFTPREAFAALIDKVSGKGTWERNPYVFVYEFEQIDYEYC